MKLRALPLFVFALLPLAACNTPQPAASTPAHTARNEDYRPRNGDYGARNEDYRPRNGNYGARNENGRERSSHSNRAIPQAVAGSFDLYLLNLSWSPEYCHSHPGAAECAAHDTFVLHGLWPENADGTYPSDCSTAPGPANPAQYNDLYPDPGLLQHEWQTHGTCSGLGPDAYFQTVRTAYKSVAIPSAFTEISTQTSLPPTQIETLFTTSNPRIQQPDLAVSCGGNYLTAVEVCLDKSLHPVACPTAIHSCGANTVRIPAPQ